MTSIKADITDVIDTARPIVERVVWATICTAGSDGAPRSRLMHPVWSWDDASPTALVSARRTPIKVAHLEANPQISCFYWDPRHDTVAIEATASWVPPHDVERAWDEIASTPPPVGFDPAMIWPEGPGDPGCAFLRLTAHRILATEAGRTGLLWQRSPGSGPRSGTP